MTTINQQFTAEDIDFLKEAFEHQGAMKAGKALRASIHSSMVRTAIMIEDRKLWRPLGYKNFADYLNTSGFFPFGSTHFYKLKELLKNEGPAQFDVLTGHRISHAIRLELSEHGVDIELDGDEIVIQGNRVPTDDKHAVTEAFKAVKRNLVLRDHNQTELEKKQEKLEKSIEHKDRTITNLRNAQCFEMLADRSGYLEYFLSVREGFKFLTEETKKLPMESKQRWRQRVFDGLSELMLELSQAFDLRDDGLILSVPAPELTGDELTDYWAQGIHKASLEAVLPEYEVEELAETGDDDNDAELAASL